MVLSTWRRFKSPKDKAALLLATWFGSGLSPKFPGTMGSIFAIPLLYFTLQLSPPIQAAFWVALFVLGCWSAASFDQTMGTKDSGHIVIDEVVGMGISCAMSEWNTTLVLVGFVLFRIFDIWKPWPIRLLDQASKKATKWKGFGVMIDDVAAGCQALIILTLLQHFELLRVF